MDDVSALVVEELVMVALSCGSIWRCRLCFILYVLGSLVFFVHESAEGFSRAPIGDSSIREVTSDAKHTNQSHLLLWMLTNLALAMSIFLRNPEICAQFSGWRCEPDLMKQQCRTVDVTVLSSNISDPSVSRVPSVSVVSLCGFAAWW